jgi:phage gp29-like protein
VSAPTTIRQLPPNTELVEVTDGYIICKEAPPSLTELGSSGMTNYPNMWRGEYKPELAGQSGRRVYHKMKRSDGQVHGLLRLAKTPILAARWYVAPPTVEGKKLRRKDRQMAEFVHNSLFHYQTSSFPQMLSEGLEHLTYGFYAFEKVWEFRRVKGKERVVLKKLAPRHPLDVDHFEYDAHGGPTGLVQYADGDEIFLPIGDLIVFTNEMEGQDMEGVSMFRPAYKHWYYKEQMYKVDAIQKERHGIGIPVIKLPPSYTPQDKAYAQELGRNLRTNENAHVVLPPMWELMMLKLEGHIVDPLATAEHHDKLMARAVLGQFLNVDTAGTSIEEFMDLFLKSSRFVADQMRDVINKHVIPELINFNFDKVEPEDMPELRVRRLGDTVDWRTISFALRNLVGAGIIVPDDRLEEWIREEMDLPVADEDTERKILDLETPQGLEAFNAETDRAEREAEEAETAGLPRQSQAGNMTRGPGNVGRTGQDRSGGS